MRTCTWSTLTVSPLQHVHVEHSYSVPPPGKHVHAKHGASAQYAVDCCAGPMCNNATAWPDLPGVPSGVDKEVL